jgi:hypothetical protein
MPSLDEAIEDAQNWMTKFHIEKELNEQLERTIEEVKRRNDDLWKRVTLA